jgi:hypothetical protein
MATCGHCKQTGQTVAHVRTCGIGTEAHRAFETLTRPELAVGNVVTLANADGYWVVLGADGSGHAEVEQSLPGDKRGANAYITASEVELVFANVQAAVDYELALRIEAGKRRDAEILHGDPNYCRGCAKGWRGAKWHRDSCPVKTGREEMVWHGGRWTRESQVPAEVAYAHGAAQTPVAPRPQLSGEGNTWGPVNELRNAVKEHLHYENKLGGRHKREGRFAVVVDGATKFLRIKLMLNGNYAGRVFVDSQASDDYFPVKAPATLTAYLAAVLVDPVAAAKLYADELGVCSRCGRTLTNDESRAWGIGPECRNK